MLDVNDFSKKQILVYVPSKGDKISYRNDNVLIADSEGKVKFQTTCYRIFTIIVVGDCSITTGLLRRAKKFGFSICFMTYSFRLYSVVNVGMEGNTLLRTKQYSFNDNKLAQQLVHNKIVNQRAALKRIREKGSFVKEGIELLDGYIEVLEESDVEGDSLLAIEGNAARVYFPRVFNNVTWNGRKPRIKHDYINSLLDIGYTLLFNFIDAILQVFGFDVYKGVLHKCYYMRKSLVCDIMEPFRPIIDWRVRKGIALGQFKDTDFCLINHQWQLNYKMSGIYSNIFIKEIMEYKEQIFRYIRGYYRLFMKGFEADKYVSFLLEEKKTIYENELEREL